jgi:phosphosulfolactate phosphohydrolase-like enzyme
MRLKRQLKANDIETLFLSMGGKQRMAERGLVDDATFCLVGKHCGEAWEKR